MAKRLTCLFPRFVIAVINSTYNSTALYGEVLVKTKKSSISITAPAPSSSPMTVLYRLSVSASLWRNGLATYSSRLASDFFNVFFSADINWAFTKYDVFTSVTADTMHAHSGHSYNYSTEVIKKASAYLWTNVAFSLGTNGHLRVPPPSKPAKLLFVCSLNATWDPCTAMESCAKQKLFASVVPSAWCVSAWRWSCDGGGTGHSVCLTSGREQRDTTDKTGPKYIKGQSVIFIVLLHVPTLILKYLDYNIEF